MSPLGYFRILFCLSCFVLPAGPVFAANSGVANLFMIQGSGSPPAQGDYISAGSALDTYYSFWVEVPPGTGQLHVDIFDADVGAGLPGEDAANRDLARGGLNTSVNYQLRDPASAIFATATLAAGACAGCDNAWATFAAIPVINPAAGHWELRVNVSSAVTGGNEIHAFGVRAHDGTPGAGGRELPVYYDTFTSYGTHLAGTVTYTNYPYLTSGCVADVNNFDWDGNGSITMASPFGLSTQVLGGLSGNNVWQNRVLAPWTTDSDAVGYGLWTATVGISVGTNYGVLYLASSSAANPPPTAQPQTGAFRVYLPTDAGAIPTKPRVEQIVRHLSGPNPPAVGMTSRVEVRVRLFNPTPWAITFSAPTNVVTANVPGGLAVYAGSATVTQGTITAAPAIGAGGNVVWNPGTLAAGANAELVYQVDVTPTLPGQRVPVTGTPAANGTTARYRDETANATQTRATYTWGPLCELAVTVGLLTHATIADFRVWEHAGQVLVEWQTSSEAGTLGFRLERLEGARWVPVGEGFLPGLLQAPQGGTYRLLDQGAKPGESLSYRLIEIETMGSERVLGLRATRAEPAPPALLEVFETGGDGYQQIPRALLASPEAPAETAVPTLPPGGAEAVWAEIGGDGLVRITAAELAAAFGSQEAQLRRAIERRGLTLSVAGDPVAWWGEPSSAALRFYGQATQSPFSRRNAYRLEPRSGLAAGTLPGRQPTVLAPEDQSYQARQDFEVDRFAAIALPLDPRQDFWFWEVLSGGHPTLGSKTFTFDAPALAAGAGAVSLRLQGASASGVAGEHHAVVELNGVPLGETSWQGMTAASASFDVPAGVVRPTGNTLRITALRDAGVPQTIFYVDGFEVRRPRYYTAAADRLEFAAAGHPLLTVRGFLSRAVEVVEISDPQRPRRVIGTTVRELADGFAVSFYPSSATARYAAAASLDSPAVVRPAEGAELLRPERGASGLLVTVPALLPAAERLAEHRREQGENVLVVTLQAVTDAFGDGVFDPLAIQRLLAHAWQTWPEPPRWVLLAGAGTYDYKNNLGLGGNLLPPRMVATSRGLYASDLSLGDVDGDDVPEIAVGRLPVTTLAELDAYVDKLIATESDPGTGWAEKVVLLADGPDNQTDFGVASDRLAALLPAEISTQKLYLAETPAAAARAAMLQAIAEGVRHLSYAGHGGADRLDHGLLFASDAAAMSNGARLPIVTALTCTIARFEIPGFEVLGEALVRRAGGGAIAVFASSGVSNHAEAARLGEQLFQALYRPETTTLGEAVRQAAVVYAAQGGAPEMLRIYNLLGDPALRLKPVPEPPPGPTTDE